MSTKMLPFLGKKPEKEDILEQGTLGDLEVVLYKRGTVHIKDPKHPDLVFKKDPELFEKELEDKIKNLKKAVDGDMFLIEGCGDNDNLVFTVHEDDFVASLSPRTYGLLAKLKGFIGKAKAAKKTTKK